MKPAPIPANEAARLQALRNLHLLDTAPEERFDRITRMAKKLFQVPIVLISLIDEDRQWFKSRQGLSACETARSISFCSHAILQNDLMVIEDTKLDDRFANNPLVTGEPYIRFYAGHPLVTPDGLSIGTVCLIDHRPRVFGGEERLLLRDISKQVEVELASSRIDAKLTDSSRQNYSWIRNVSANTAKWLTSRLGAFYVSTMVALTILATVSSLYQEQMQTFDAEIKRNLLEHITVYRAKLESILNSRLHLTHGLAGLVHAARHIDDTSFQTFAQELGGNLEGVRSLQLAPEGIVTYVWPLEGNRAAIGHDLFGDPNRRQAAQAAIDARKMWVAGPFELIQGGLALIGRKPIFLPSAGGQGNETFWGFATILIDFPNLIEQVGIFERDGPFRFALRGKDHLGTKGEVFFGEENLFEKQPLIVDITFPAGSWQLGGLVDKAEFIAPLDRMWWMLSAVAIAALLSSLVYFLLRLPEQLRFAVTKATAALERSETRFRDAIEALPDGFVIYDADDRLVLCNDNYRRIYQTSSPMIQEGCTFEEIIRYGYQQGQYVVTDDGDDDIEALVQARVAVHRNLERSIEQLLDNGKWLRIEERRMRDGGIVGFRVDITELKRKEEELRAAKERAEQLNQAKSAFLATVSHEVRTPLNGVLGLLRTLKDDRQLTERQYKQASTAHDSAEQLLAILNQILDLSKLEAGKLELEEGPFDVREIVHSAVSLIEAQCEQKGLRLAHSIAESVPQTVVGDSGRLRQILINLLNNAVKFTDRGSVFLKVEAAQPCGDSVRLRFKVKDTGIGLSPNASSRLFEPFAQGDNSTTRRHQGTGLGLAICKSLVTLMGGDIGVEAELCKGSRFYFDIVAKVVDTDSVSAAIEESEVIPVPRELGWPPLQVLAVEDSPTNQIVLKFLLDNTGYQVDTVGNGLEAIAAVQKFPYHLVLMDISMPDMDGIETTRRIRELPAGFYMPIIALTANVMKGDKERYIKAGMNDYLPKPINKDLLLKKLYKWVIAYRPEMSLANTSATIQSVQFRTGHFQ